MNGMHSVTWKGKNTMNFINALNVYDVNSPKVRIGNKFDGGYIINEQIIRHTKKIISIGMGNEDSFEREWFSKYSTTYIEAYDGTYPCQTLCSEHAAYVNKNIFYVQRNVGYNEGFIPLNTIVDGKQDVLLKVDVEGAEYEIFDNIKLSDVTGLLLEVHDLDRIDYRSKLIELIQNQFSDLILFHIHGNSWSYFFDLDINDTTFNNFPAVLELSFINRKLVNSYELDYNKYPIAGIDYSNNPNVSDIDLYWVNSL
jgi:hypothetical protein